MRFKIPRTKKEWLEKGEHFFHMSYLVMVSVEGHGYYRIAAALLFCVTGAGVFVHRASEGEDHHESR